MSSLRFALPLLGLMATAGCGSEQNIGGHGFQDPDTDTSSANENFGTPGFPGGGAGMLIECFNVSERICPTGEFAENCEDSFVQFGEDIQDEVFRAVRGDVSLLDVIAGRIPMTMHSTANFEGSTNFDRIEDHTPYFSRTVISIGDFRTEFYRAFGDGSVDVTLEASLAYLDELAVPYVICETEVTPSSPDDSSSFKRQVEARIMTNLEDAPVYDLGASHTFGNSDLGYFDMSLVTFSDLFAEESVVDANGELVITPIVDYSSTTDGQLEISNYFSTVREVNRMSWAIFLEASEYFESSPYSGDAYSHSGLIFFRGENQQ